MGTKAVYKTTREDIAAYWSARVYEGDMGCDWSEALTHCWRCGCEKKSLHRCHIVPAQEPFNGPDMPSNFVLLCAACHGEAPSMNDPDGKAMWEWIRVTSRESFMGCYDTFWSMRAVRELKTLYGIDLLDNPPDIDLTRFKAAVDEAGEQVGIHFAPGTKAVSTASLATVLKLAIDATTRQPASPEPCSTASPGGSCTPTS